MLMLSIESLMVTMGPVPSMMVLRPSDEPQDDPNGQVLPIWVGSMEATAIAASIENKSNGRPLTHELATTMVRALGGRIARVVIDRVEGTTFYSTIYINCDNGMYTRIDARPSDAVALAVRNNAPIFVEDDVFSAASRPRSGNPHCKVEAEIAQFHEFIDAVEPDDFVNHGGEKE